MDVYIQDIQVKNNCNMQICHFFTSKTWLEHWVLHSKQLATIAKMLFVTFVCQEKRENGQHRRWTDKEKLVEARLIIKTDNYL